MRIGQAGRMRPGLDQIAQALALGRCLVGIAQQPQRLDPIAVEDDGRIMAEAVSKALVLRPDRYTALLGCSQNAPCLLFAGPGQTRCCP